MIKVVGVRFRTAGKAYYFDPKDFDPKMGDRVVVETARGLELGTVSIAPRDVSDDQIVQPLKEIVRMATEEDIETEAKNLEREKSAFKICKQKVIKHGLEMKLVDAEYTFDGKKLLFYFTADGRVDFRELVKDLAAEFRTRIELRQIGVRDETKTLGGFGICGRALCCSTYLTDFVPVSIKMAKEQNLSLNPTKISGLCGRLMCCLKNEQETYEYLNSQLPNMGDYVTTPDGQRGQVKNISVLRQLVRVVIEENDTKEEREYHVSELKFRPRRRKNKDSEAEEVVEEVASSAATEEKTTSEAEPGENKERHNNRNNRNRNRKHHGNRNNRGNHDNNGGNQNNHGGNSHNGNNHGNSSQGDQG